MVEGTECLIQIFEGIEANAEFSETVRWDGEVKLPPWVVQEARTSTWIFHSGMADSGLPHPLMLGKKHGGEQRCR